MKNLLKLWQKIVNAWHEQLLTAEMGIYIDGQGSAEQKPSRLSHWLIDYGKAHVKHSRIHTFFVWLFAIQMVVWQVVATAMCRTFGHKTESDDWAGPDSGGMGWHCERCGAGDEVILY